MPATTIDEVLAELEAIIEESKEKGHRAGYFASLYHLVTSKVKEGIQRSDFEDGSRMERLDVLFANRYLAAHHQWRNNLPLTDSWRTAFQAAEKGGRLVIQHLLLGINAHINLDLGIAAVETIQTGDIRDIHKDFDAINAILGALTYEVIHDINRISPLLSLIGKHSGNTESLLVQFSIGNARDGAWCFAEALSQLKGAEYAALIAQRDKDIATLAGALVKSKGFIRFTIWIIYLFELKDTRKIIYILRTAKKKFIKAVELTARPAVTS
jgi:hypothetical protein